MVSLEAGCGGAKRDRTADLLRAKQALSQLSYSPLNWKLVGLGGFEPPTSPLSGVRSNQLSYRPRVLIINKQQTIRVGTTQSVRSGMGLISSVRLD